MIRDGAPEEALELLLAVGAQHKPQLQRAEAAADGDLPVLQAALAQQTSYSGFKALSSMDKWSLEASL